jgi:class 3 adenylate cyclase/DNA-binding winged helix-turn-helix (wHTH) protein
VYRFHDYTLDPASRELRHGVHRLALEPKVFQVLLYLLEHRDRMVPKAELLAQCWPETFVSEAALTRCLARLRKAVQPTPAAPPVIETRHRQGYRFVAAVTVLDRAQCPPAPVDTVALQAVTHTMVPVLPATPAPPPRPVTPAAERRQLTVMFCDVVDSTTLAGRLDPEDFCAVMVRYHATCMAVIERYGGHVAQYLGDGLLVYFGWPQAHEDDARRAIHAGLVVVGTGEEGTPYGQLAVGATPHLAAKLQSLAAPETVVISTATSKLVQGYFVCQPLGEHILPGTTESYSLYQVLRASGAHGRLDVTPPPQLTPFVGRETELTVLREWVAQVRQGQG